MKRVEESLLRTDYKKHIQVQGGCQGWDLLWGAAVGPPKARGLSDGPWQGGSTGQLKGGAKLGLGRC